MYELAEKYQAFKANPKYAGASNFYNGKVYAFGCDYKHGLIKLKQNLIEWIKL